MTLLQEAAHVTTAEITEVGLQANKAAATPEELVGLSTSLDQLPPNSPPLFPLDKADKIYSGQTAARQPDQALPTESALQTGLTSEKEKNQDNSVPWLPTVAALSFLEALATSTLVKTPRLRRNLQRLGVTGLILSLTGCTQGTPGTVAPTPAEGSTVTATATQLTKEEPMATVIFSQATLAPTSTPPTEVPPTEPAEQVLFTFTLEAGSNITAYEVSADGSLIFDGEGNPQVAGSLQVSIPGIEVLSESTDGYAKLKLPGGRIVWVKDADIAAYVPQVAEQPAPTAVPPVAPTPGGEQPPPAPVLPTPGGVEATPIPVEPTLVPPPPEPTPVPPPPETQPGGAVMTPEEVPAHVNHGGGQFNTKVFDHRIWGVIPESAGGEYVVQFRVLAASADGLRVDAGGVEKILPINGAPVYLTNHGYVGTINQLVLVDGVFNDGDLVTVYVQEFALRDARLTKADIQASSITPLDIMISGAD